MLPESSYRFSGAVLQNETIIVVFPVIFISFREWLLEVLKKKADMSADKQSSFVLAGIVLFHSSLVQPH